MSDEVALLVRLAGTSRPIAPERRARVRTAVYGAWSDENVSRQARQPKTRRLTVAVLFAAAASVVMVVAIWVPIRRPAPVQVAHVDHVTEQATGSPAPFTAGGAVMSGSPVMTSAGTLAMTLTSGVHLRLAPSSTVRPDSASVVTLERGAVYVNSTGALPGEADGSPISIRTPAGDTVRDIGTQFVVRLDDDGLRVGVRDGEVIVTYANGSQARVRAGDELLSRPDGSDRPISRASAATGSEWEWAERAAPPFSVAGKTLGEFLDWVSREGAWTVTFADSTISALLPKVIDAPDTPDLLRGLTLAQALDVVLPTSGLRYRLDNNGGHRVVIERETSRRTNR
jgi:ferric-dicitrate binding protein FerR (iron transport regulator)